MEKITDTVKAQVEQLKGSALEVIEAGKDFYKKAEEKGTAIFSELIDAGTEVESRAKQLVQSKVKSAEESAVAIRGDVTAKLSGVVSKVEDVVDNSVSSTLHLFGLPNRGDLDALAAKLDELDATVKTLKKKPAAKTKAA